jgi:CRP-like cAMP-binding protein
MKKPNRESVISELKDNAHKIRKFRDINEMILIHELMLSNFYSKKPFFYKMIFKYSRFYIVTVIYSIYYCTHCPTFKNVKFFFAKQERLISVNTLTSLLIQLRVSGRIDVYRNKNNRRESLYRPSSAAIQEIYDLIQCVFKPWEILHGEACGRDVLLPSFFFRYGDFVFNFITMKDLIPEAELFIEKDAGHMIMLILYREYVHQNSQIIMLTHKKIANYSHVSRSHVFNVLREAQSAGFITVKNNLFIELSDRFIRMFRMYFSFYLAQVLYSIDVKLKNRKE